MKAETGRTVRGDYLCYACQEVDLRHGDDLRAGTTVFLVQIETPSFCCVCGTELTATEQVACEEAGTPLFMP